MWGEKSQLRLRRRRIGDTLVINDPFILFQLNFSGVLSLTSFLSHTPPLPTLSLVSSDCSSSTYENVPQTMTGRAHGIVLSLKTLHRYSEQSAFPFIIRLKASRMAKM